jgi:O-antigen biosynthesis protein
MDRLADEEIRSYWDRHHQHRTDDPDFWMADADCRRAINRRVTGDTDLWPLDWFHRTWVGRPFRRALSLGCGSGSLERSARRLGLCESITGVDASEASLAEARAHASEEKLDGISYRAADLNALTLPRAHHDAVLFHQSLHHVRSVEKLLARVARALEPEGLLYLDEWTGPSRSEWRPERLATARALYDALPVAWRLQPALKAPIERYDLSETVRSSAILPAVRRLFEVVEERPYGGQLVAVLLPQVDAAAMPPLARRELVRSWLALEDEELGRDSSRSYHTVIVARPRRGASAALGQASNFAVRVGLALRYRVPTAIRIVTGRHKSSAALPPHLRNW